jgi:hypothetical protein
MMFLPMTVWFDTCRFSLRLSASFGRFDDPLFGSLAHPSPGLAWVDPLVSPKPAAG